MMRLCVCVHSLNVTLLWGVSECLLNSGKVSGGKMEVRTAHGESMYLEPDELVSMLEKKKQAAHRLRA